MIVVLDIQNINWLFLFRICLVLCQILLAIIVLFFLLIVVLFILLIVVLFVQLVDGNSNVNITSKGQEYMAHSLFNRFAFI